MRIIATALSVIMISGVLAACGADDDSTQVDESARPGGKKGGTGGSTGVGGSGVGGTGTGGKPGKKGRG